jgi:hypothetical protein
MPSFCLRLLAAVLVAYPCGRLGRSYFFQPVTPHRSHPGNDPGRARRINLGSGHRWSCVSDLHQAVDLRDSTHRTGRPACHQFKAAAPISEYRPPAQRTSVYPGEPHLSLAAVG